MFPKTSLSNPGVRSLLTCFQSFPVSRPHVSLCGRMAATVTGSGTMEPHYRLHVRLHRQRQYHRHHHRHFGSSTLPCFQKSGSGDLASTTSATTVLERPGNPDSRGTSSSWREPLYSNRVQDSPSINASGSIGQDLPPGARAFVECDRNALMDLFYKFAIECSVSGKSLDRNGLEKLLRAVGETVDADTLGQIFEASDLDGSGSIDLNVRLSSFRVCNCVSPASV